MFIRESYGVVYRSCIDKFLKDFETRIVSWHPLQLMEGVWKRATDENPSDEGRGVLKSKNPLRASAFPFMAGRGEGRLQFSGPRKQAYFHWFKLWMHLNCLANK